MIKELLDAERVFVIDHFLSEEECAALIRRSEAAAYEPGTVGGVVNENFRNNERVIVDDESLASNLFNALNPSSQPFLMAIISSASTNGGDFIGINPARRSSLIATAPICG